MPLLDDQGRLFGRLNIVDAAVVGFLLLLFPIAYATFLLFRPSAPRIDSVTRADISREELRLASGTPLSAKLKVRGTGFNPMLRASIGETPALAFVFENPNSADVLVGAVPPGTHDLVLFDGVQEVARAPRAVTLQSPSRIQVRLVGRFLDLEPALATGLEAAEKLGTNTPADAAIIRLGPVEPARERMQVGPRTTDLPIPGRVERDAVANVRCDPQVGSGPCTVGGINLTDRTPVLVWLSTAAGLARMALDDVLPVEPPQPAQARVRLVGGAELAELRVGDRDAFLDERAAAIAAIGSRVTSGSETAVPVTLTLGVDPSREGWRYRGRLVVPGAPISISTPRYVAVGTVESLAVTESAAAPQ